MISVRNLDLIRSKDVKLYEALVDIQRQTVDVNVASPSAIGSLTVTAANGMFTAAIYDGTPPAYPINYFLEYDTSADFTQPYVVFMGPSRNISLALGNQTLYFRAYSQYAPPYVNTPSPRVTFGTPPTAVVGGGSAPPSTPPSAGSGSGSTNGQQGGSGYGPVPSGKNVRTVF